MSEGERERERGGGEVGEGGRKKTLRIEVYTFNFIVICNYYLVINQHTTPSSTLLDKG